MSIYFVPPLENEYKQSTKVSKTNLPGRQKKN
jgi:hypothetical protein